MPWIEPREGVYGFPLWREVKKVVVGGCEVRLVRNLAAALLDHPCHLLLSDPTHHPKKMAVAVCLEAEAEGYLQYLVRLIEGKEMGSEALRERTVTGGERWAFLLARLHSLAQTQPKAQPQPSKPIQPSKVDDVTQSKEAVRAKRPGLAAPEPPKGSPNPRSDPSPLCSSPPTSPAGPGAPLSKEAQPKPLGPRVALPREFGLPQEFVIAKYAVSLWTGPLPRTGELYLTPNFLCWRGAPTVALRYLDVVHVRRYASQGLGAALAFEVFVRNAQDPAGSPQGYTFASFFKGEELYLLASELWKATTAKVQRSTSQANRQAEASAPSPSASHCPHGPSPDPTGPALSWEESQRMKDRLLLTAENLITQQELEWLKHTYHLPPDQKLLARRYNVEMTISMRINGQIRQAATLERVEGSLYCLPDFLVFVSDSSPSPNAPPTPPQSPGGAASLPSPTPTRGEGLSGGTRKVAVHLLLPYREIEAIKKASHTLNAEYQELGKLGVLPDLLRVYTHFNLITFAVVNREGVWRVVQEAWGAVVGRQKAGGLTSIWHRDHRFPPSSPPTPLPPSIVDGNETNDIPSPERQHRLDEAFLGRGEFFSAGFAARDAEAAKQFDSYFQVHGRGLAMLRTPKFRRLVTTVGVPGKYRTTVWLLTSGAQARLTCCPVGYYWAHVERARQADPWALPALSALAAEAPGPKKTKVAHQVNVDQIELDLHRSCPEHPYFNSQEGLDALRRVLQAYSIYNPVVGYCQSMNIVAAVLLLFADEEEAFYLLASIVDQVPEYYIAEMLGSIVDLRIFAGLVAKVRPTLADHLTRVCGLDLSLTALPWFLCLYVSHVPWEVTLRIFDSFFSEGPGMLFQIGIAFLAYHEAELMKKRDQVEVTDYFKHCPTDADALLRLASSPEFFTDPDELAQLRNFHKFNAVLELETKQKEADFASLARSVRFPRLILESLYEDFRGELFGSDGGEVRVGAAEFGRLFRAHLPPGWSVDQILQSQLGDKDLPRSEEVVERLYGLFDANGSQALSFVEYVKGLDVLYHGPNATRLRWSFALFDRHRTGRLTFAQFAAALKVYYTLAVQFSEKQSVKVEKKGLALMLEAYNRKVAAKADGVAPVPASSQPSTPSSKPKDSDLGGLDEDWCVLSAAEQFDSEIAPKLGALFRTHTGLESDPTAQPLTIDWSHFEAYQAQAKASAPAAIRRTLRNTEYSLPINHLIDLLVITKFDHSVP